MKYILINLSITLIFTGCTLSGPLTADKMVENAEKVVTQVEPDAIMKVLDGEEVYTLIDVREKNEYYYGFIPGSVNIPRGSIEFNITNDEFWENEGLYKPANNETVILYCKKGKRSILAAKTLTDMGFKKVMVIDGGWKKWELKYPDFCDKNLEMLSGGGEKHDDGGGC